MSLDLDDSELVVKIGHGDRNAFAAAYTKYVSDLFRFAANTITDKEDCEEIIQDVFVSLWERRENLEIDSLKAYLFSSVKYKIIRYIKHQAVKRKYEEHYRHFETTFTHPTEPDQDANVLPLNTRLGESLQGLPARCREAFQLRLEQNLTNTEIAQRMQISKRTVEEYMTTAFAHLRKFRKEILGAE
ncbi:MAG TPA: RNA polymerase sigma-70 factor [Cyclobacteriaceae bacterium]|nr:RNA polymerase sigma-70 factor [Cyclobacteriaceae bacterium]